MEAGVRAGRGSPIGALGAVLGGLGVAAGAFGAHALRQGLAPAMLDVFETATRYQLVHAVAMIVTAVALERRPSALLSAAGWCFGVGIVLFSGSLYALSLIGPTWWGAVTPFGGVSFLAGWSCLALALGRGR